MGDHKIKLISFGYFEEDIHKKVAIEVQQIFDLPVELSVQHLDLNSFFDSQRKQYNGNLLLKHIETNFTSNLTKTIGLFSIDLFIPILTYIFGQAYLGGNSGIASMYRLGNERYGLPPDPQLLQTRFIKEIVHELGHCYGLIHCHTADCVMRSSTYAEDIDQKEQTFCTQCTIELQQNFK